MNPNTLRAQFDRARRTAGRPDLHFHTLRATYVNGIQHNGATLKETMELAGHTAATVDALYQRADEDRKRVVADRYGRYLTSSVRTDERILKDIADTTAHLEELRRELARSTDHTE